MSDSDPPAPPDSPNDAEDAVEEGNDGPMKAAIWSVALTALVLAGGAAVGFGLRPAIGVAVGGAIATANLLAFARIGQAFLSRKGNTAPWAIIAVIKLVGLLGGIWLILKSGYVSGLYLTIGYGSLPIGITLGSLFGPKPPEPKAESRSRERR